MVNEVLFFGHPLITWPWWPLGTLGTKRPSVAPADDSSQ